MSYIKGSFIYIKQKKTKKGGAGGLGMHARALWVYIHNEVSNTRDMFKGEN
jgi:hypothetical protein